MTKQSLEVEDTKDCHLGSLGSIFKNAVKNHKEHSDLVKMLDCFLAVCFYQLFVQFMYYLAGGDHPYNAFVASTFSSLGLLTLGLVLRFQLCVPSAFPSLSTTKAFGDFVICSVCLFVTVFSLLG
eukprot:Lankesteria_metandrocarpae@DN919_c0_g1_i1.p2